MNFINCNKLKIANNIVKCGSEATLPGLTVALPVSLMTPHFSLSCQYSLLKDGDEDNANCRGLFRVLMMISNVKITWAMIVDMYMAYLSA